MYCTSVKSSVKVASKNTEKATQLNPFMVDWLTDGIPKNLPTTLVAEAEQLFWFVCVCLSVCKFRL